MIALLEMPLARRLVPLALALLVAGTVFEMIRRRKLREEYALMWLAGLVVPLLLAIFPHIVIWLQEVLQINYLTIVALLGFGMTALILLQLTVIVSKQAAEIRSLTQRLALQNHRLELLADAVPLPDVSARQAVAAVPEAEPNAPDPSE